MGQLVGFQGQLEGSDGQLEASEGQLEGPEGQPAVSEGQPKGDGQIDKQTEFLPILQDFVPSQRTNKNFSLFYRSLSPFGVAAQKQKEIKKIGRKRKIKF